MHGSVGKAQGHEPAPAKVSGFGKSHGQRIGDRDGSIDGIAAPAQDVEPGFGRQPVGGNDHAVIGCDRHR
jgi:hypothetical protein